MPFIRCREYDDNGRPTRNGGCPKKDCSFIHPTESNWSRAPRSYPKSNRGGIPGRGRGSVFGRGGPGPRERTASGSSATRSNSTPLGGRTGSTDSVWGSRASASDSKWGGAWGSDWDKEADKIEGGPTAKESSWGGGWGFGGDDTKSADNNKEKGKGKATDTSSGWGWGQTDIGKIDTAWTWGENVSDNQAGSKNKDESGGWNLSSSAGWGISNDKDNSANKDEQETAKDSSWPFEGPRPVPKAGPLKVKIPSTDHLKHIDLDSPRTSRPSSAMSLIAPKPLQAGPSTFSKRPLTPDVPISTQTSRAGSLVPALVSTPDGTRSLRDVRHKEGESIWSKYIDLIRRSLMLKLRLVEEWALYKDYKKAQNSPNYVKVGQRGTKILDESMRKVKANLERVEKEYKSALDNLCAYEEGFEFPLHALLGRKEGIEKMRQELAVLRQYVKVAKSCVGEMQVTANDIESQTKVVPVPVTPAPAVAPIVKVEPQKSEAELARLAKKEELEKRLATLKEKATDLFSAFIDAWSDLNVDEAIQHEISEMKASLENLLETEGNALSERTTKLDDNYTSLGRDLEELCGHVAGLYTSFKQVEVAADNQIHQLQASLDEDRQLLIGAEENSQACRGLLDRSAANLELLRQELNTLSESKVYKEPEKPPDVPQDLLDQLVEVISPLIREQLYPDIETALRTMSLSANQAVQELSHKQVRALVTSLAPVYDMSNQLYAKHDLRGTATPTIPLNQIGKESPVVSNR